MVKFNPHHRSWLGVFHHLRPCLLNSAQSLIKGRKKYNPTNRKCNVRLSLVFSRQIVQDNFFTICCCKPNAQTNHSIVMDQQPKDNKGRSCRETKSLKQKRRINPITCTTKWGAAVTRAPTVIPPIGKQRSKVGAAILLIRLFPNAVQVTPMVVKEP